MRTDEDRIIEMMVIEQAQMQGKKYDDMDFLPVRQSLYTLESRVPPYDEEASGRIVWCRPNVMSTQPEYFNSSTPPAVPYCVAQGTLPDETFLGTLLAVSAYPHTDLLQNIFCSSPEDFRTWGVYTCRFYVEGEWVEVITDTSIPCTRNEAEGTFTPVYARSPNPHEFWVSLAEKAYAKAVGSYEAIQRVRVHEALLHLTGGSVQQISLQEDVANEGPDSVWHRLLHMEDALILCQPKLEASSSTTSTQPSSTTAATSADDFSGQNPAAEFKDKDSFSGNNESEAAASDVPPPSSSSSSSPPSSLHSFQQNRLYSIMAVREFCENNTDPSTAASQKQKRLVLLHDPWSPPGSTCWNGAWTSSSTEWDEAPEIIEAIRADPGIPWTRVQPAGYFWMPFDLFVTHFNATFVCKLFPNDKFAYYCLHGKWKGREAGGPVQYVKPREIVAAAAAESRIHAALKSTAAVVVDGDTSWFNNPQFRVQTQSSTQKAIVYISLVPLSMEGPEGQQVVSLSVTKSQDKTRDEAVTAHLWDGAVTEVIAQDSSSQQKVRGQEVSIWALHLDPKHVYHVVAETMRLGQEGSFIARIFSMEPLLVDRVEPVHTTVLSGDWRVSGDLDTRGGPPFAIAASATTALTATAAPDTAAAGVAAAATAATGGTLTENPKWCQNPQYHLEIANAYGKEDIHLKIVLRRTDKPLVALDKSHRGSMLGPDKNEVCVGLVVCKADSLEDLAPQKKKGGGPRQNAMGELLAAKPSSLKKKKVPPSAPTPSRASGEKTILRKIQISNSASPTTAQTSFSNKTAATVYYPKMPRSWVPNGFLVVPSLSEKGIKGSYDLEIYCSEKVTVRALPDTYSRSIAGEWTEALAGGSHLSAATWKKNPKFTFRFKNVSQGSAPARVRISLARHGAAWKAMARKDTVGCMIGFYLFISRQDGELLQVYESPFLPNDEMSTDSDFQLEQLAAGDEYVIMPATFAEDKCGAFVLSVIADYEFALAVHKR